ncbi:hypothetical protein M5E89_07230 [Acidaminococcus intestini]|nr:hypothetical protein M5E89_07230 [Acidaminococcus intestini]
MTLSEVKIMAQSEDFVRAFLTVSKPFLKLSAARTSPSDWGHLFLLEGGPHWHDYYADAES